MASPEDSPKGFERGPTFECGLRREYGVIRLIERCAPERHDGIPFELIDRALVFENNAHHHIKIFVELLHHFFRGSAFGKMSEIGDVGKKRGDGSFGASQF